MWRFEGMWRWGRRSVRVRSRCCGLLVWGEREGREGVLRVEEEGCTEGEEGGWEEGHCWL